MSGLKELELTGKLFVAGGTLSMKTISDIQCIFFNQNLVEDFSLTSPYTLVTERKWTLDTLMSLSEDIYSDLNANGQADPDDRYAFMFIDRNYIKPFMQSCDLHIKVVASLFGQPFDGAKTIDGKLYNSVYGSWSGTENALRDSCVGN